MENFAVTLKRHVIPSQQSILNTKGQKVINTECSNIEFALGDDTDNGRAVMSLIPRLRYGRQQYRQRPTMNTNVNNNVNSRP